MVDDSLLPHIEKIQSTHHVINLQREEIDKQNTIIQTLQDKLDKVEERVEGIKSALMTLFLLPFLYS